MAKQCRVTIEIEEDGKLIRKILDTRCCDKGVSDAIGHIVASALMWIEVRDSSGLNDALAAIAICSCHSAWADVASAYNQWTGEHDFDDGVKVVVDGAINKCDGGCPICNPTQPIEAK